MSNMWYFDLGNWLKDSYTMLGLEEWKENEDFDYFLKINKYDFYSFSIESEYAPYCKFYEHDSGSQWLCCLSFNGCSVFYFLILNNPSMLMFIEKYGKIFDRKQIKNNFLKLEQGKYINKNQIKEIEIITGKNKNELSLLLCDRDGEWIKILDNVSNLQINDFINGNIYYEG